MIVTGSLARVSPHRWITMPAAEADPAVVERCNSEFLSHAIAELPGVSLVSVSINTTGYYEVAADPAGAPSYTEHDLPDHCEVKLEQRSPEGHVATVRVWVPLVWNGRFLGAAGGGNRLGMFVPGEDLRMAPMPSALRNGFATAHTDGGYGTDPRLFDWQLDDTTGELHHGLIENWIHRSTHEMTVIAKAVTTAIHAKPPRYSYFQGSSGGGRQAMAQVQRYPGDYDGVWAVDPAINWTRFMPAELWPALVMKELGVAPSPAKFQAFRSAVIEDFNHHNGTYEPFVTTVDPPEFDATRLIGIPTAEGEITEADATVMNLIWDGPRTPSGDSLWFGLRPGAQSWLPVGALTGLLSTTTDDQGLRRPDPFMLTTRWFATWILGDPGWDWTTLTFEGFAELFQRGLEKYPTAAIDDPDLSGLRDSGGKLLLTHGLDDPVIFSQGTRHYFDRVLDHMGDPAATGEFARFFPCPGDGHVSPTDHGIGLDLATGMLALMHWVEDDTAPDTLDMHHRTTGTTRSVHPYGL